MEPPGGYGVRSRRTTTTSWAARLLVLLVVCQPVLGAASEVWTAWSDWSECSFSCGRGVRSRYRECVGTTDKGLVRLIHPTCPGRDREFVICTNEPCPPGADDERESQCSEHNTDEVLDTLYHWVPFYGGPNPCELTCLARGYSFYYNFGHVRDGTPCKKHGDDLCVSGHCAIVGCDDHVGSNKELDDCGVCGGENSNCAFFRRTYAAPLPPKGDFGYTEVVKIPSGSTQLKIKDTSNNYLALADSSMTYIINGNWVIDWPGRYEMAGTTIYYGRSGPDNETITADGPIKEDLHLMLIFRERNPGVSYQFWLPGHKLDEIKIGQETPVTPTKLPIVQQKAPRLPQKGQSLSKYPTTKVDIYKPPYSRQLDASQRDHGRTPEQKHATHNKKVDNKFSNPQRPSHDTRIGYGDDAHYALPRPTSHVGKEYGTGSRTGTGILTGTGTRTGTEKTLTEHEVSPSELSNTQAWWDAIKRRKLKDASRDVNPQLDDVSYVNRPHGWTSLPTVPTTTTRAPSRPRSLGKVKTRRKDRRQKSKSNHISSKKDSCAPCKKVKDRAKHFCQSQFVIHTKVLGREEVGSGNDTRYDVKVISKFRDLISLLGREYIWVPNRCHCPRLHDNKEYLIMGALVTDAVTREGRLQLTRDSFVRGYNLGNEKRMNSLIKSVNCDKYG